MSFPLATVHGSLLGLSKIDVGGPSYLYRKGFLTMTKTYQKKILFSTSLLILFTLIPSIAFCVENPEASQSTPRVETLPVLPKVTVTGVRIAPMTGATIIDREMIDNLPGRNGSVNELISNIPGVQYSEERLHSFTGGEITPPGVSISGSRFYENNYTIDGFSNNSALEPATTSIADISILPGHPQQIFLDSHLISQVTVYDSNIPAEHGAFTGGMVATETLDPIGQFRGNVNYRTTRSSWTQLHIHPDEQEDFQNSETETKQPRFRKSNAGFSLNTPINRDMGILISYQRKQSDIPLTHFGETKEQTRLIENFFIKYGYHITNRTRIFLTGIHAPYKNEFFRVVKNSDYSIKGGASSSTIKLEHDTMAGTLNFKIGYRFQKTERDAPLEKFKWSTNTESINWEKGLEGGSGPLDTSQEDFELSSELSFLEFSTGPVDHQSKAGITAEHTNLDYNRPVTSYSYTDSSLYPAVIDPTVECNGDVACIDNEQYLLQRYVYEKNSSNVSYNHYAVYLQDAMSWQQLELFPGVRVSYDSSTENTNFSPRLSAAFDISDNRKTILFGGVNRYYSGTLLSHKLRESISASNLYETRLNLDDDFAVSNEGLYRWKSNDLKTPYSDEWTLGFTQSLFRGELKAQYIERNNRDEIARERTATQEDGYRYYLFNNNGRSKHKSYQLTLYQHWRNHYFELNGTYQETTTSNLDYNTSVDADDVEELVWYNGSTLSYHEIPRTNYNRPSIVNLVYSGQLPFNTKFTNIAKFRDAYYRYKNTGKKHTLPNDSQIWIYEKKKYHSSITFDWRFSWAIPVTTKQRVDFTLDIYNVFNEKNLVSYYEDEYELGRQFWAGVEFSF